MLTQEQILDFNFWLIENKYNLPEIANNARTYTSNKQWLNIYDILNELEYPKGPLISTTPKVPKDVIQNIRKVLNDKLLKHIDNISPNQLDLQPQSDNDDDKLQPV